MANILDIVRGLSQAAANAYDGYENVDEKIGLKREEGHPITDSRVVDGFRVWSRAHPGSETGFKRPNVIRSVVLMMLKH